MLRQSRKNLGNLCGSLSFSQNYFWHSCAQGAMVVHFGKAEVFKRQMPQALYGFVGRKPTLANFFENFADAFSVQRSTVRILQCRKIAVWRCHSAGTHIRNSPQAPLFQSAIAARAFRTA